MPPMQVRFLSICLMAFGCPLLAGCFGLSQNPGYFPYLLPTGDIVRTHAKPPGLGYFANFDPHAVRLEVRPNEMAVPVRGQQVLIATIYDENDLPRRKRRVEWIVEGPGNIIEVDESGYFQGRGYKVDNKYAVSYTDYREHVITRGNDDPRDDFAIRPGQSWCVLSSAVEGQTTVTVYAPEIQDWEKSRVFIKLFWVDAQWEFPQPVSVRAGTVHTFTTKINRHSDKQPINGYRVRYRLEGGPKASFVTGENTPSGSTEIITATAEDGTAKIRIQQQQPAFGTNDVAVEILQPDGNGGFKIVGRSKTKIDWQAQKIQVGVNAPKVAQLNQEVPVVFSVASVGPVDAQPMLLKVQVPPGLDLINSPEKVSRDPSDPNLLLWKLNPLASGQQQRIEATFRASKLGSYQLDAAVPTMDGQRFEGNAAVQVSEAKLELSIEGPGNALVGEELPLRVTVRNPGNGDARNVKIDAKFDDGLEVRSNNPLEKAIERIGPNESKTFTVPVIVTKNGRPGIRALARGDGNIAAQAQPYQVQTAQAGLQVSASGPRQAYVNQEVTWKITVQNPSDVQLSNVVLRASLPSEVTFKKASFDGRFARGEVVWNLGTAPAREEVVVEVTALCNRLADRSTLIATVMADPLIERNGSFQTVAMAKPFAAKKEAEASVEILGIPSLQMQVADSADPIEVGRKMTYNVRVQNEGSLATNQVELMAEIPSEFRPLRVYGPIVGKIDGQKVSFPAIDNIRPGATMIYTVEVEAVAPGDARFRGELKSQSIPKPIRVEESTRVLPRSNAAPPPPRKQ